jgi:predicted DNA-binding ribbon-helix-helix protein
MNKTQFTTIRLTREDWRKLKKMALDRDKKIYEIISELIKK